MGMFLFVLSSIEATRYFHFQALVSVTVLIICSMILIISLLQMIDQKKERQKYLLFKEIFDQSSIGIALISFKGTIQFVNAAFAMMLEYESSLEFIQKPIKFILPDFKEQSPFSTDTFLRQFEQSKKTGFVTFEFILKKNNDQWLQAELLINKIIINQNISLMLSVYDITERKRVEKLKDEFVEMISHELRVPLSTINSSFDLLAADSFDNNQDNKIQIVKTGKRNIDRLNRLISDILDSKKISEGLIKMNFDKEDIVPIIEEAIQTMAPFANSKKLIINLSQPKDPLPSLYIDKNRIFQVMINLLSNAIKYTDEGNIDVSLISAHDGVMVKVSDTGIGIKNEDIPKLFQRFSSVAPEEYRKFGSTGLGLVICKQIIEKHKGKIWVESTPEVGSSFIFHLPAFIESLKL